MIRRLAIACVAALLPAAAIGQEPEVFHDKDPSRWGAPARIVEPEYPREAVEQRITGYVDFEGVVTDEGSLRDIEYRAESAQAEIFIPALRQVVPRWVFYPALGADCMPEPKRYVTRVWFELDGDRPKITATRRRGAEKPVEAGMKPVHRVHPRYPRNMQLREQQALVYSRLEVEADGSVSAVAARAYPRDPKLSDFERSVADAFRQWRFTPAVEGGRRRHACVDVVFRLP